ncbi:PH domain-containing protein [Shewanella sp. 30m-9]
MNSDTDSKLGHEVTPEQKAAIKHQSHPSNLADMKQTSIALEEIDNPSSVPIAAKAPTSEPIITINRNSHTPIPESDWLSFDQVPLDPVDAKHYTQVNIESLIFSCLLLVAASLIIIIPGDFYLTKILGVSTTALLIISLGSYLRYQHAKSLAYAVCDHELIMQQGFWWVKRTSLPYSRLQHVSVSHGPLERHFNLATIKCFSAGSGSAEIELPGIEQQTAERLRQHLLAQAAKANPKAAAETKLQQPEPDQAQASQTKSSLLAADTTSAAKEESYEKNMAAQQGHSDDT